MKRAPVGTLTKIIIQQWKRPGKGFNLKSCSTHCGRTLWRFPGLFWKFSILIGNFWYTLYHNKKSKQSVRIVFAIAIMNKHQVVIIYSVIFKLSKICFCLGRYNVSIGALRGFAYHVFGSSGTFDKMEVPPEAKSVGWVEAGEEVGWNGALSACNRCICICI